MGCSQDTLRITSPTFNTRPRNEMRLIISSRKLLRCNRGMSTATTEPASPLPEPKSKRLVALDAFRGFDMFWIVGGESLIVALAKLGHGQVSEAIEAQMEHKSWSGVAFYDLIFPTFAFIIGVSLVFSLSRTLTEVGRAAAIRRILVRSFILFLVGVFYYNGLADGWDKVRWVGVLQRLAIGYCGAGILFCFFKARGLAISAAVILIGYWAMLTFVPIRDVNLERKQARQLMQEKGKTNVADLYYSTTARVTGKFDDGLNVVQHFDFEHLPGRKYDGNYDPEGILSNIPAVATCLLGALVGLFLKNSNKSSQQKVAFLCLAGFISVGLGFLWGIQFPVIKKIWTSSYVLVAAGYSTLGLALFYQVIEVWGFSKWATPFVWIGMNPITIYIAFSILSFSKLADRFVGGPVRASLNSYFPLVHSAMVVLLMFLFVRFLYKRKIFLRL
ncbi:MAG: hypothetical protein JWN25_1227 [Verrucomicrobiales bacterium]|nr:hypothetical protein [Verrucomicrobiales bacterium]MDB6131057.1 hypothetical protein [Verrucomicrobiales bacterium]